MNPELENEILHIMDTYSISYDDAAERHERRQRQTALACDRKKATKVKGAATRSRQQKFKEASQQLASEQDLNKSV